MSKAATKALIDEKITGNGVQAITGPILNNVLNTMVDDYGTQDEVSQLAQKVNENKQDIVDIRQAVNDIQPIVIEGNVTNAPDEEDITTDENDLLQFADRTTLNGMGYKILRRNKTFAEQVTDTNTIYEIRYNFDLSNANVAIPSGCILKFSGGKVSNGTLVGNETKVEYSSPIFSGMKFSGTWRIPVIKSSMFEDSTRINAFQEYINLSKNDNFANRIVFEKGDFYIKTTEAGYAQVGLSSNTEVEIIGDIHLDAGQESSSIVLPAIAKENISIFGSGSIIGDRDTNLNASDYGWCLYFDTCNNVKVSGITMSKSHGDGCYFLGVCNNIEVDGCTFNDNRRMGVAFSSGRCIKITNNTFLYVGRDGTAPMTAVEFEDDHHTGDLSEVLIQNNRFSNCYRGVLINQVTSKFFNFVISNNSFIECTYVFSCTTNPPKDVVFENNDIINSTVTLVSGVYSAADNIIIRNNYFDCPESGIQGAISITGGRNVFISNNNVRANVCIRLQYPGCKVEKNICFSYDSASENYGLIYDYRTATDLRTIISENDITGKLYFVGEHIEIYRNIFRYVSGGYGCTFGVSAKHNKFAIVKDNQFVAGSFTGWQFYCTCDNCTFDGWLSDNPSKVLFITGNNNSVQTIEKIGTTAERPSYLSTYFKGTIYYDTDLGKMIVWNGSAWGDTSPDAVQSLTAGGKKIWAGTQSEYDLLTPSNDTLYFIKTSS